jgi:hypothetical protein
MVPKGKYLLTLELHETIEAFSIKLLLFSEKLRCMSEYGFLLQENTCRFLYRRLQEYSEEAI